MRWPGPWLSCRRLAGAGRGRSWQRRARDYSRTGEGCRRSERTSVREPTARATKHPSWTCSLARSGDTALPLPRSKLTSTGARHCAARCSALASDRLESRRFGVTSYGTRRADRPLRALRVRPAAGNFYTPARPGCAVMEAKRCVGNPAGEATTSRTAAGCGCPPAWWAAGSGRSS